MNSDKKVSLSSKQKIAFFAFGILFICCIAIFLIWGMLGSGSAEERLQAIADQYTDIPGLTRSEEPPYLRGKVIVVEEQNNRVDYWGVTQLLPYDIRPQNQGDVGTIIRLGKEQEILAATYEGGIKWYVLEVDVTVIDVIDHTIVAETTIYSSQPKDVYTCFQPCDRDRHDSSQDLMAQVAAYIKGLPKR